MDYILSNIQKHTRLYEMGDDHRKTVEFYRMEIEYACFFLLAYLWNKNLSRLDAVQRESVSRDIQRPAIGTVIQIARTLDVDGDLRATNKLLAKYPALRNQKIGHGFIFDDDVGDVLHRLKAISTEELRDADVRKSVFDITSGRPLFIFQLAHIWAQTGSLRTAVSSDIKSREQATEFLYGRIFNYLSSPGRILFRAIGRIVTESDMSNLISRLRLWSIWRLTTIDLNKACRTLSNSALLRPPRTTFLRCIPGIFSAS